MSIKLKMTLWYSSFICLMVVIALGILLSVSQNIVSTDVKKMLKEAVNDGKDEVDYKEGKLMIDEDLNFFEDGIYIQLYSEEGNLLEGHLPSRFIADVSFSNKEMRLENIGGKKYYVYDRLIEFKKHENIWIRGIVSGTDAATTIHTMIWLMAVILPLLAVFSIIIGYVIAKKSLMPIERISLAASEISEGKDLSKRINLGNGKDEVYQLANTFDHMFERLEKSFEAEKQLTSDLSHEIRTPISVILSHSEYALGTEVTDEERREVLKTIYKQAERMRKMISQLLAFTRLERGIDRAALERMDLSELTEIICEEQAIRTERGIQLTWEVERGIMVLANFELMTRLIINLVNNAFQYGKADGMVKVTLGQIPEHKVRLCVSDDGIGIAKEEQEKIWKRFYQVNGARSASEGGNMGLGLSMVEWIAEYHHGEMKLESKIGEGSDFIFEMPMK